MLTKNNYYFDSVSKFHYTVFIQGRYSGIAGEIVDIKKITCCCKGLESMIWTSNHDSDMVAFEIQILLKNPLFPEDLFIEFHFEDDTNEVLTSSYIREKILEYRLMTTKIDERFRELISDSSVKKILDIGGRARSGLDRSKEFPDKDVVVLDIIEGENVNIVGDAHKMSDLFEPGYFDAVYCVSVFEHLIMPWKVALEMNKVMRLGAVGLVHTHQTIGMHDLPWDFYRFSDTAWKGIFNKHSGFEILQAELRDLQYIIPFYWRDKYYEAEKSAGYEGSTVLVKKIGDTKLEWPLGAADVTMDIYPDVPDNNKLEHMDKL